MSVICLPTTPRGGVGREGWLLRTAQLGKHTEKSGAQVTDREVGEVVRLLPEDET